MAALLICSGAGCAGCGSGCAGGDVSAGGSGAGAGWVCVGSLVVVDSGAVGTDWYAGFTGSVAVSEESIGSGDGASACGSG